MRPHFRGPMREDFNFEGKRERLSGESEDTPQYDYMYEKKKHKKSKKQEEDYFQEYYEDSYFEKDYSESLLYRGNKRVKESKRKKHSEPLSKPKSEDEDSMEAQGQYEVEMVTGRRERKGKLQYKIFWKGFTANDQTWEDYENLHQIQDMIDKFENLVDKYNLPSKKKKKKHKSENKVVIDESMRRILSKEINSQQDEHLKPKKRHSKLIREMKKKEEEQTKNLLESRKSHQKIEDQYVFSQISQALEPSVTEEKDEALMMQKEPSENKKGVNLLEDSVTVEKEASVSLLRQYPDANAEICWDELDQKESEGKEVDVHFDEERAPQDPVSEEIERGYEGGQENTYSNQFALSPRKKARVEKYDSPLMYEMIQNRTEQRSAISEDNQPFQKIEVRVPYLKSPELSLQLQAPREPTPIAKERKEVVIVPKKEFPTPSSKEAEQNDEIKCAEEGKEKHCLQKGEITDLEKLKTEKNTQLSHLTNSTRQTQYMDEWDVHFSFEVCGFTQFEDGIYCKVKWQRKVGLADEEKFLELPKYLKKADVKERFPLLLLEFYEQNHYLISKR